MGVRALSQIVVALWALAFFGLSPVVATATVQEDLLALFSAKAHAASFFDLLPIQPAPGQTIVFANQMTFLGDTLIQSFGKLEALHERYPQSKIKVMSPYAGLLQPSDWLIPIPVGGGKNRDRHEIREVALANFGANDFVIVDRGSDVVMSAADSKNLERVYLTYGMGDYTPWMSASIHMTPDQLRGKNTEGWETDGQLLSKRIKFGVEDDFDLSIYQQEDLATRFLFGREHGVHWPTSYFADIEANAGRVRDFLSSFPRSQAESVEPHSFVVINLNTAGEYKVRRLQPRYVEMMRQMIDHALTHSSTHSMNVAIPKPEPQYGERVNQEMLRLVDSYGGKVKFLPEDKSLWLPIVHAAQYVITQDSGFMHLAMTVQPEERVLGIGVDMRKQLLHWAKPGQPIIEIEENDGLDLSRVFRWMDHPQKTALDECILAHVEQSLKASE